LGLLDTHVSVTIATINLTDLTVLQHQARAYVVQEEVLRGEASESLLKVQTSLEILQLFRSTFEDRRAHLSQYQRNGSVVKPWDFNPLLAFSGLDRFINRIRTIKVRMETLVRVLFGPVCG